MGKYLDYFKLMWQQGEQEAERLKEKKILKKLKKDEEDGRKDK